MSTKKAVGYAALFVFLLFAGDRLIAAGLERAIDYSSLPLAKLYSGRGAADVLVLGNSRAFRHFQEDRLGDALGMKVSNLAQLGGSMASMEAILEDHIARYGPPRAVVIEPSCLGHDDSHVRNLRVYARRSERLRMLLQHSAPAIAVAGEMAHLFALNGAVYLNLLHKVVVPYRQKMLEGSGPLDAVQAAGRPYFHSLPRNLAALERILDRLAGQGTHVEVVVAPVFTGFRATGAGYDAWLSDVARRVGTRGRTTSYADLPLPPSAFRDPVHLNREGVDLFFRRLAADGVLARLTSAPAADPPR